jgi:hypothetical protein
MNTSVATSGSCRVELRNGESWINLFLDLGAEFTGGQVVRPTADAKFDVAGADELSASYGQATWLSGLASGAFYAYRTLKMTRRVVNLGELTGKLRSGDMDALAAAAACAVARCLGRELPLDLQGWEIEFVEPSENHSKSPLAAGAPAPPPAIAE